MVALELTAPGRHPKPLPNARLFVRDNRLRDAASVGLGLRVGGGTTVSGGVCRVTRLEELGLIERSEEGAVSVPFEAVEILVPLAQSA